MYDSHVHTTFSNDGLSTVNEQVQSAIDRGVKEITITDHVDINAPYLLPGEEEKPDMDAYVAEIMRVKKLKSDSITVHLGMEVGLMDEVIEQTREYLGHYPFDFLLASVHSLSNQPDLHRKDAWQNVTKQQGIEMYIGQLLRDIKLFKDFDCCAHLTYFSRYAPFTGDDREITYADGADVFDALFTYLIENGKGIEINTSTIAQYGFGMPGISILQRYHQMGGEIITMGSDAHQHAHIAGSFDIATQMLKQAGFDYVCTFNQRKPAFHRI